MSDSEKLNPSAENLEAITDEMLLNLGLFASGKKTPDEDQLKAVMNLNPVKQAIMTRLMHKKPLSIWGFWGASGDKSNANTADFHYLADLTQLQTEIAKQYRPGVNIFLLLADVHAKANGVLEQARPYLDQIGGLIKKVGFTGIFLSHFYDQLGLTLPDKDLLIRYNAEASRIIRKEKFFITSAGRHSKNGLPSHEAAKHYLTMRLLERDSLYPRLPEGAILLVNGSKRLGKWLVDESFPIVFKDGGVQPPWFR